MLSPISIIPAPWRYALIAIAVAMAFAAVFAAGHRSGAALVQGKWDAAALQQAAEAAKAESEARARELSINQKYQEAQNAALEKQFRLRADYDAVRNTAHSLRDSVAALRGQLSAASAEAARATADASLAVFGECAAEVGRLAQAADGHAADAEQCAAAWPE